MSNQDFAVLLVASRGLYGLERDELTARLGFPVVAMYAEADDEGCGNRQGVPPEHTATARYVVSRLREMLVDTRPGLTLDNYRAWSLEQLRTIRTLVDQAEAALACSDETKEVTVNAELADAVTAYVDQHWELQISTTPFVLACPSLAAVTQDPS